MTFREYLYDKVLFLLLQLSCMLVGFAYLRICGLGKDPLLLFYLAWIFILFFALVTDWYQKKKYFDEIEQLLCSLSKPYLIGEIMPASKKLEDQIYRELIRRSNKSVIDAIHNLETKQQEYKEFIEQWIHEVKLPITRMELICENNKTEETRKLAAHLAELEHDVEQALFYARSDTVSQDYMVRSQDLKKIVLTAIQKNQQYFIQNKIQLELAPMEETVYCDDKWVIFTLCQILINAVKYKKDDHCLIKIYPEIQKNSTCLCIEDNGIGIKQGELNRVFEKGFTGTNGRRQQKATGIGLYLCRKLCKKQGIEIEAESKEGEYTRIRLVFPDGSDYFSR